MGVDVNGRTSGFVDVSYRHPFMAPKQLSLSVWHQGQLTNIHVLPPAVAQLVGNYPTFVGSSVESSHGGLVRESIRISHSVDCLCFTSYCIPNLCESS